MAKYEVDPVSEIQRVLGKTTARKVQRAMEGAGELTPGGLARLAEGFNAAAGRLKDRARQAVTLDQGKAIDLGVVFSLRKAYVREVLDQKAAKLLLPRELNPDLYSDAEVDETVQIAVGPAPQE